MSHSGKWVLVEALDQYPATVMAIADRVSDGRASSMDWALRVRVSLGNIITTFSIKHNRRTVR